MSKKLSQSQILELVKNYFPTSDETIATESKQPLTYAMIDTNSSEFRNRVSEYLEALNVTKSDSDAIKDLIVKCCNISRRIALAWIAASQSFKDFYILGDGIIGYIQDQLQFLEMTKYYEYFDVITTTLHVIIELD